ncbi:MAG: hypothetical protein HYY00_03305 [Chloroflexi bacterium]|nr:hypothetical protein [Chloroflexota bacterium]
MRGQLLRGKLVAVVDGPAMVLEVRGQERQLPLVVSVALPWIAENMDKVITVLVEDGKITQIA